ncbi:MAG: aldehyde ferredoxin oxidoreductase C-terminal domain-containing protein, partial [Dehalococcoidales bacterium]|nr:aldehyde ferredoxin oxidoreductase C-terminal domain-containing protein [Dehalococcoidales bacterium]
NAGRLTKHTEDQEIAFFSLGICTMSVLHEVNTVQSLVDYYKAATGLDMTTEELRKAGERVWNLTRLLNFREGFTKEDDKLPRLWEMQVENPIKTKSRGEISLFEYFGKFITPDVLKEIYADYYDEHGWDAQTGVPTKEKLVELGIEEFAGDLKSA